MKSRLSTRMGTGKAPASEQPSMWLGEGTVVSYSPKVDISKEFGRSFLDVPSIKREYSVWYVDESNVPHYDDKKPYFVMSAVTELSPVDCVQLFKGMPLDQDRWGNEYVHFSYLMKYDNDNETNYATQICKRMAQWGANDSILIIQYPVNMKYMQDLSAYEIYQRSFDNLISAIKGVDKSDQIEIVISDVTYIHGDEDIPVTVTQTPYFSSKRLWMSDIAASSLGKGLNKTGRNQKPNAKFFDEGIRELSINTSELVPKNIPSKGRQHRLNDNTSNQNLKISGKENVEPYQDTQSMYGYIHIDKNTNRNLKTSAKNKPKNGRLTQLFGKKPKAVSHARRWMARRRELL